MAEKEQIEKIQELLPQFSYNKILCLLKEAGDVIERALDLINLNDSISKRQSPVFAYQTSDLSQNFYRITSNKMKIIVAEEGLPSEQIIFNITQTLSDCNCKIIQVKTLRYCLQAEYEEKFAELPVDIEFCDSFTAYKATIDFVRSFIQETGTAHDNVEFTSLAFGNMPNCGLFFLEGEYLAEKINLHDILDIGELSSWAHFEHNTRRILTFYFTIKNDTISKDDSQYVGFKLVWIVHCDSDSDEKSDYIFIHLKYPPQFLLKYASSLKEVLARSQYICFSLRKEAKQMLPNENFWINESNTNKHFTANTKKIGMYQICYKNAIISLQSTFQLFEILSGWKKRTKNRIVFGAVMKVPRREPKNRTSYEIGPFKNVCLHVKKALNATLATVNKRRQIALFNDTIPPNCVFIRKIIVTPLRILLFAPQISATKRIIRRFGEENALRCVFRDDNGKKLVESEFSCGRAQRDYFALAFLDSYSIKTLQFFGLVKLIGKRIAPTL
ncbi:unnamed protein product [Dracunculus medinensis]|uniref:CUE domain-containing protein n=1 Tax=Dracunculus medinensis TaxID=318479 RepID=A0A0N4UNZ7_DRAME|nr:unnamed protein product [Dracunculus medinensis]